MIGAGIPGGAEASSLPHLACLAHAGSRLTGPQSQPRHPPPTLSLWARTGGWEEGPAGNQAWSSWTASKGRDPPVGLWLAGGQLLQAAAEFPAGGGWRCVCVCVCTDMRFQRRIRATDIVRGPACHRTGAGLHYLLSPPPLSCASALALEAGDSPGRVLGASASLAARILLVACSPSEAGFRGLLPALGDGRWPLWSQFSRKGSQAGLLALSLQSPVLGVVSRRPRPSSRSEVWLGPGGGAKQPGSVH